MSKIEIGSNVQWTHIAGGVNQFSLSLREGKVIEINGKEAVVEKRSGCKESVVLARLRLPGEKSQITEFIEAVR